MVMVAVMSATTSTATSATASTTTLATTTLAHGSAPIRVTPRIGAHAGCGECRGET
jgi:hypothetical protein